AIVLLLPRVLQMVDSRVAPLVERIAKVEAWTQGTDASLTRLNNDIAKAIDDNGSVVDKGNPPTTAPPHHHAQLAARPGAATSEQADSSVFAVAVVQLRSAFYSGRPFEAELVNVYALARGDDKFVAPLNILTGPSRTGVPTASFFRDQLPPFVKA